MKTVMELTVWREKERPEGLFLIISSDHAHAEYGIHHTADDIFLLMSNGLALKMNGLSANDFRPHVQVVVNSLNARDTLMVDNARWNPEITKGKSIIGFQRMLIETERGPIQWLTFAGRLEVFSPSQPQAVSVDQYETPDDPQPESADESADESALDLAEELFGHDDVSKVADRIKRAGLRRPAVAPQDRKKAQTAVFQGQYGEREQTEPSPSAPALETPAPEKSGDFATAYIPEKEMRQHQISVDFEQVTGGDQPGEQTAPLVVPGTHDPIPLYEQVGNDLVPATKREQGVVGGVTDSTITSTDEHTTEPMDRPLAELQAIHAVPEVAAQNTPEKPGESLMDGQTVVLTEVNHRREDEASNG